MVKKETKTFYTKETFISSLQGMPYKKALIVLTKNMAAKRYDFLRNVLNMLTELGINSLIFDELTSHIAYKDLQKGAALAKDFNCDLIVGIGGAKTIDAAKLIALFNKNSFELFPKNLHEMTDLEALDVLAVPTTIHLKNAYIDYLLYADSTNENMTLIKHPIMKPAYVLVLSDVIKNLPLSLQISHMLDLFYSATERFIVNQEDSLVHEVFSFFRSIITQYNPDEHIEALLKLSVGIAEQQVLMTPLEAFEKTVMLFNPDIPYGAVQSLCAHAYFHKLSSGIEYKEKLGKLAKILGVDVYGLDFSFQAEHFLEYLKTTLIPLNPLSQNVTNYGLDSAAISDYVHHIQPLLENIVRFDEEDLYDIFEKSLTQ